MAKIQLSPKVRLEVNPSSTKPSEETSALANVLAASLWVLKQEASQAIAEQNSLHLHLPAVGVFIVYHN